MKFVVSFRHTIQDVCSLIEVCIPLQLMCRKICKTFNLCEGYNVHNLLKELGDVELVTLKKIKNYL